MKKPFIKLFPLLLVSLLLTGCPTSQVLTQSSPDQLAAIALLEQGQAQLAAQQLESLANNAKGAQRNMLLADAAYAWHQASDNSRANFLIPQIQTATLNGPTQVRFALLIAEISNPSNQFAQALTALASVPEQNVPENLRGRWYLAQAQASEGVDNLTVAAKARSQADAYLQGNARNENQRTLRQLLDRFSDTILTDQANNLAIGDPLYNFIGRALISRGLPLPRPFDRNEQWRLDTSTWPAADQDGYRPPQKLAVLLPLTGNLATAGASVRDGLLAGYYAQARRKPEITFYDTTSTPRGALNAYQQAMNAGAEFVIGPLGRDEVTAIFAQPELRIPMLALNRGQDIPPPGMAEFAMAPEVDGIAAAEYLLGLERRNVVAISSNDDTGKRAMSSFIQRFTLRGGNVLASIEVSDTPNNIAGQLTGINVPDSVFLALKGPQARAVMPQLALASISGTRVGTSQLTSGTGNSQDDISLDGIAYPTESWTTRNINGLPSATTAATLAPTAQGAAGRLFAFGHDAWLITAYLEKMSLSASQLQGATGILYLDGMGDIIRTPAWSTFSNGNPMPIAP